MFDSIFSEIAWIDKMHDCDGCPSNGCHGNGGKALFQKSAPVAKKKNASSKT